MKFSPATTSPDKETKINFYQVTFLIICIIRAQSLITALKMTFLA